MAGPVARRQPAAEVRRSDSGGLADVVELVLDKGLAIDAFVRVSPVRVDVAGAGKRGGAASVETYLRLARAIEAVSDSGDDARVARNGSSAVTQKVRTGADTAADPGGRSGWPRAGLVRERAVRS